MKKFLEKLINKQDLSFNESKNAFEILMEGEASEDEIFKFLTNLSEKLKITAETENGIIMGIEHKKFNVHGVQFHPESIKTAIGIKILKNFINYKK